jgi:hypothetical protein
MQIAHLRLANQRINERPFARAEEVVAWLGAMQGQDYAGTLWAIGLRMINATEAIIEQALAERRIVRTWPLRGTLHFVAAPDVRWLLKLLTPRVIAQTAARYRQLALDNTTFAASQEIFIKTLAGGQQLTRDELYRHLEAAGIATTGQRGYHLLVRAAQDGLICFGAPSGNQQTFTLLDEWIAPTPPKTRDEALAELARRYFTSHGPATMPDLMRWAGITAAEAKLGLAAVGNDLLQETVGGVVYWRPDHTPATFSSRPNLQLLPGFDEYILGYGGRDAVLDPAYARRICPGGNGVFSSTMVVDGRVVGTWKRTLKKNRVVITPDPFQPLSIVETAALRMAAERYGAFLGLPVLLPE